VFSPHTLHFQHAMLGLEHGCDVFVEKPMVTEVQDAYRLRDRARELGRKVLIGYNTPCQPTFHCLRRWIREQRLGALQMVSGYLSQDWLPRTRGKWRQDPALSGGGQAYDSGAHLLNSLIWAVEQPVESVAAFVDCFDIPVDVNTALIARFAGNVMASISIGGDCGNWSSQMTFLFQDGRIDIDGWTGKWMKIERGRPPEELQPDLVGEATTTTAHFVDVLHGRVEPHTNPDHGVLQSELLDLIYESARSGGIARAQRREAVTA
jgi:predicted dehydrogenase